MRTSRSFLAWTLVPPALRWFLSVAVLALPLQLAAQDKQGPSAFTGRWELTSDDGTDQEVVELSASGNEVSGTLTVLEHGYFSRRTTVKARLMARGNWQAGGLQLRVWNPDGSAEQATTMTARLRDEYLILAYPGGEAGYARPGRPLVRSAEGSAEAETLARLIVGRIYSVTNQASGRGAFVGGRVKLALCADGSIAYDASNLVATQSPLGDAGVDGGESVSRRGQWSVVLLAGAPTVQARWQGTGSSYSLTRYFRIRPDASGQSAEVDGKRLPMTGRC